MISSPVGTRAKTSNSLVRVWMANSTQAQIMFRIFLEGFEAQRAANRHHFAFDLEVTKTFAFQHGLAADDAVLLPIRLFVE